MALYIPDLLQVDHRDSKKDLADSDGGLGGVLDGGLGEVLGCVLGSVLGEVLGCVLGCVLGEVLGDPPLSDPVLVQAVLLTRVLRWSLDSIV